MRQPYLPLLIFAGAVWSVAALWRGSYSAFIVLLPLGWAVIGYVLWRLRQDKVRWQKLEKSYQESLEIQTAILENARNAIITTDRQGIVKTFNKGAESMLGLSAGDVIGRPSPFLFKQRDSSLTRVEDILTDAERREKLGLDISLAPGSLGIAGDCECVFNKPDGTTVHVLVCTTAMRDHKGLVAGFVLVCSNLSTMVRPATPSHHSVLTRAHY